LANQGETVVAFDPLTGNATTPAIVWQDRRANSVTESMRDHEPRLFELTGLPLDPYFTAPKLRWLADRAPKGSVVVGIDAWCNLRLTGRLITDRATASRSGILDLDTRNWSEEALGLYGLDSNTLPELVDCAGDFGATTAFGPSLRVTALCVDQQAALIGEGCMEAGEAKCTYGTGAFLLVSTGPTATRSSHGLSTSVAWQISESFAYCVDGQIYTAGAAIEWLIRLGIVDSAGELDAMASAADESATPVCVPAFAGLGAPEWEPTGKGVIEGMTLATGPNEIVAAVLEGLAAQVALLVRAAEADLGSPLTVLRVDGGLTQSDVLMQLQADLLQIPVELFASPDATALGIAALARQGLRGGPLTPLTQASGDRFEPTMSEEQAGTRLARFTAAAGRVVLAAKERR
jgi:glycerol kinase